MKQELIDELWNQATRETLQDGTLNERYHFAKLVAEHEREACAMVCEELPAPDIYNDSDKSMWDVTTMDCAEAIRARSN